MNKKYPRPTPPASLLHQPHLRYHHPAIYALAHVVNRQQRRARRHQGLHLHAGAVVDPGLDLNLNPILADGEIHANRGQIERVA